MTDTDIKALVARLRKRADCYLEGRRDEPYYSSFDTISDYEAADALEALQTQVAELREVKDGYYEAMADWRVRAEKAEVALSNSQQRFRAALAAEQAKKPTIRRVERQPLVLPDD